PSADEAEQKGSEARAQANAQGRNLWEQVDKVVRLRKQFRASDSKYADALSRVRYGRGTVADAVTMNHRLLTDKKLRDEVRRLDLPLLTVRNAVKTNVAYDYLHNWV